MRQALDAENLTRSARARYNIELVFEEIVGNILRYGAPHGQELHLSVQVRRDQELVEITVEDDGIPFDPCSRADCGSPASLVGDRDGGFGLMIVRHASSSMRYERTDDGRNRLVLRLSALD